MIELALHWQKKAVQVSKIASRQKIPVKYLEQILRDLKLSGMVKSERGPKGGHRLIEDPSRISLGRVARLFEGQTDLVDCISFPEKCEMASECLVRNAWHHATLALYHKLDEISIADLIDASDKKFSSQPSCPVSLNKLSD